MQMLLTNAKYHKTDRKTENEQSVRAERPREQADENAICA